MTVRRLRAAVALFTFVTTTIGVPVVDAVWYHDGVHQGPTGHVESTTGADCHAERCSLATPAAPVAPVFTVAGIPEIDEAHLRAGARVGHDAPLDRTPPPAPGSRAPPA